MTTIQQLEADLQNAKDQEKLAQRGQELAALIAAYQGKCIATHTFDRSSTAGHMGATYYEKFFIKDGEIFVREWRINLSRYNNMYKKTTVDINYSRGINEKQLTGLNDYNANYNLGQSYSHFLKDISLGKFMEIWEVGQEAHLLIKAYFDGKAPEIKTEWISQGDHNDEDTIDRAISEMGLEMIDLKAHPKVHRVLEYRTLPMFDRRRYLPKFYAKSILQWQVKELEKDLRSPFSTERRNEHTRNEIKTLNDFIKTL